MRHLFTLIVLLVLSLGQAFPATLTGSIKDASGNPFNGTITLQLQSAGATFGGSLITNRPLKYRVVNGVLSQSPPPRINRNDQMNPNNTYYMAELRDGFGAWAGMANVYVNSDSFDIGTAIQTQITTNNVSFNNLGPFNSITTKNLNGIIFANQYGGFTDASIQAAINAAPVGGTVFIPAGFYDMGPNLPITITKAIKLVGAGPGTYLQVRADVPNTTDLIYYHLTAHSNMVISDFSVVSAGGTPARYAINLFGDTGTFDESIIERVYVLNKLGGDYAIYGSGNGGGNGVNHVMKIRDCVLAGGIKFTTAGDTVVIDNNEITGEGKAIDIDFQPGASSLFLTKNNITSLEGVHIGGYMVSGRILGNEIETPVGFTGSNGALLDIDGTVSAPAYSVVVADNSFQVINGVMANSLRLNYANRVDVQNNYFGAGAAKDIVITANAANTYIGTNSFPGGPTFAARIDDSSTTTAIMTAYGRGFIISNSTPLKALDELGIPRGMLYTAGDGTQVLGGFHDRIMMQGADGAAYVYAGDEANSRGLAVSPTTSDTPATGMWASAANIYARESLKIGSSGTPITKTVVYTPSLTPASVNAATVAEQTFTVAGLTTADKVIVNPPAISNETGVAGARVSAADTLAIRFVNPTAGALTPTAGIYTVIAIRN